jgi:hypothetical protein
VAKAKKATAGDARLIMQLYDLRREPEMRKARTWWTSEFWPDSADDFMKVVQAAGTPENAWLRQVSSYWGMAAAFVLSGALNADLFLQPAVSGEMYLIFAKMAPFIEDLRQKTGDPNNFRNVETALKSTKFGRERLALTIERTKMIKARIRATGTAASGQPKD